MTDKGTLFVFSGPSGTGKGTILEKFNSMFGKYNIEYSISATTRQPRTGEVNGVNYYFMTPDDFCRMIDNDGFLEWASFCDNYYGTPKKPIYDNLESGVDVILEIETKGAMQIKEKYPDSVLIFVLPPSYNELENRLINRGTESPEVVRKRLETAMGEFKQVENYDYVLINDMIEKAVVNLKSIIDAERLKTKNNKKNIYEVLKNDLSIN